VAKVERFEDFGTWQEARDLVRKVYQATREDHFARDYGLSDQMQRTAVSIRSNIAEGFERGGNKEFVQSLYVAKGSAGEVRSQIYVASDLGYLDTQTANRLVELAQTTSRRIAAFIKRLQTSKYQGEKQARRSTGRHEL
jgi:four helix bundle protein